MKKIDIHHKRARAGTSIFVVLLLIYLFFFGLTYIDPAPVGGIPISFGYEDNGSGNSTSAPPPSKATPPTPVEQTAETVDNVTTQDVDDAIAVNKEEKKEEKKEAQKDPVKDPVKEESKDPVKEDPKPSDKLSQSLGKVSSQDDAGTGEGDKTGGSDQGRIDGDKTSKSREGTGGNGNGNYRLDGRGALFQPTPTYDCSEEGRVVVKVYVNRLGKVVNAISGEKIPNGPGSTTAASCLLKRAKEAALKTTWSADSKALEQQTGYIIYNFSHK